MMALTEFLHALNTLNWPAALVLAALFISAAYVVGKSFEATKF